MSQPVPTALEVVVELPVGSCHHHMKWSQVSEYRLGGLSDVGGRQVLDNLDQGHQLEVQFPQFRVRLQQVSLVHPYPQIGSPVVLDRCLQWFG